MRSLISTILLIVFKLTTVAQDSIPDIVFNPQTESTITLSNEDSINCINLLKAYSKALIQPNSKAFTSCFISQEELQIILPQKRSKSKSKENWGDAFKSFNYLSNQLYQTLNLNSSQDKPVEYEFKAQLNYPEGNWLQTAAAITFYVSNKKYRITFHVARVNNHWTIGKENLYLNNKKVIAHNFKKFKKAKINYQDNLDSIATFLKMNKTNRAKSLTNKMLDIDKHNEYLKYLLIDIEKQVKIKSQNDFLIENAKRQEVKVTESGLQYEIISFTNGEKPTSDKRVLTHYEGTFINGEKFDSSYDREEPLEFGLTSVIKGWTEGLQLMSPGSKYKFYIPYQLAYGEKGAGKTIPPFSTLIFVVELIEIR